MRTFVFTSILFGMAIGALALPTSVSSAAVTSPSPSASISVPPTVTNTTMSLANGTVPFSPAGNATLPAPAFCNTTMPAPVNSTMFANSTRPELPSGNFTLTDGGNNTATPLSLTHLDCIIPGPAANGTQQINGTSTSASAGPAVPSPDGTVIPAAVGSTGATK